MKIIVFGGAGFIGNSVVKKLLNQGHEVASVDNLISGDLNNFENLDVINYCIDITNKEMFDLINFVPDLVIHLAFPTPLCNRDVQKQFEEIATTGMLNILEYTRKNCNKIIYASSISVYGIPEVLPITEDNIISPILIYGANKYMNELYLKSYSSEYNLSYTILRISDTFGEFDKRNNAINNFIKGCLKLEHLNINGDGNQIRTYTYVEDIANAFLLSIENIRNQVFNVASKTHISINNLIKVIENEVGNSSVVIYNKGIDQRDYIFECNKFIKEFGEFETIGFERGVSNLVSHLRIKL